PGTLLAGGAATRGVAQGGGRDTYLTLGRLSAREDGIAYRTRAPRRRSPRSSQRAGEPPTRRRGAGDPGAPEGEVREMQSAQTLLGIIWDSEEGHWRAG